MRVKACKRCGRAFEPASKHTYLCPECHDAAKAAGVVLGRICRTCGATFPGGPRAWYCPDCRAERKRAQAAAYARRGVSRPIGSSDRCEVCGKPYTVQSGRQKYCPDCAQVVVPQAIRDHKRQYAADHAVQMAKYKADMSSNRHVCIICGTVFDADTVTVTCSPDCDKIRKQRHQQAADANRKSRRRNND